MAGKTDQEVSGAAKAFLCNGGNGEIARYVVKKQMVLLKHDEQMLIKKGDPQIIRKIAVKLVGILDGTDPEVISIDETIGAGVYHSSIEGAMAAIRECKFAGK